MISASLDVNHVIDALGAVTKTWLDSNDPIHRQAVSALQVATGLNATLVESAIEKAFQELTSEKLIAYVEQERLRERMESAPKRVLHVLAGNVFTAWLPSAVASLLLGAETHLKPSSTEQVFAPLWERSVEAVDAVLGQRITVVPWRDGLTQNYDAVVAYGSDETLETLRRQTPRTARFIGYGHKFSVGLVWQEATREIDRWFAKIAEDIEAFHLEGCLSPKILYIEGRADQLVRRLSEQFNPMPELRRFESLEQFARELSPLRAHLSALGYAGSSARTDAIEGELIELGFNRICRFGEMQRPPLSWRNGGFSLVEALTAR